LQLNEGERIDDLQVAGLKIIQREDAFRFGMDAVLLAHFAAVRPGERVVDLGAGTGILSILMSAHAPRTSFEAVEIQPEMAEMAARGVALNGLEERIHVHAMDAKDAPEVLGKQRYKLVVCNPPYHAAGAALVSVRETVRVARHEDAEAVRTMVESAAKLLQNGGRCAFVFPAPRMLELMDVYRENRLAPKRVCFVHGKASKPPKLMLLEGIKNARAGLHVLPPLITHDEAGGETEQIRAIYHG